MKFYLDTSIWIDFLENRNEPNFPKGEWAKKLIDKIIKDGDTIFISDNNIIELNVVGYSEFEINELLGALRLRLIFIESTEKEIGKAKDLSLKREIPKRDSLHALIARDNNAILIALENHFKKLIDIIIPHSPKEFI